MQLIDTSGWAELDDVCNPAVIRIGTRAGVDTIERPSPDRGLAREIEEASGVILLGRQESAIVPPVHGVDVLRIFDRVRASAAAPTRLSA